MAQTLANGVVIPAPGDRISAAGVQEMRTLGASVNTGLALTQAQTAQTDLQSRARDAALADQIDGMEGMTYVGAWEPGRVYRINDVVAHGGDSWARLTAGSAGEPGASPTDWGLVARKGDGGGFGELSETDVPGLYAPVQSAGPTYDSGPRRFTPTGGIIDPANTGSIVLQRLGRAVYCRIDGLLVVPGALDTWLWPNGIPTGFTIGEFGLVVDVTGGYTGQVGMNGAVRHRLTVYQNDLRYVGYLHGATATTVEASRADQTRRIYGWLPSWITDDPEPA